MNAPVINRRLWLGAVQRQVEGVPAGEPLPLAAIADRLGIAQADVAAAVEDLIAEGRLDKVTLRSVAVAEPPAAPTGQQLHRQLVDEGKRRGLSERAVSLQALGAPASLAMMRRGSCAVRPQTFEKAKAWLALPAPDAPAIVTGPALADEINAFLESTGMSPTRFGQLAMRGTPSAVRRLRDQARVTPAIAARVRDFITNPPPGAFLEAAATGKAQRSKPQRRGPRTPAPGNGAPVPIAGRMVASNHGARVAAGIRRSATRQAEAILDGRDAPGARLQTGQITSTVYAAIAQIEAGRAAAARAADPIEQAKLALRRRGRVVFAASVTGGPADRYLVGGMVDDAGKPKQLTDRELIEAAWRVNPQGMEQLTGKGKE